MDEVRQYKLGSVIPTFKAWDKATGNEIEVDSHTFNPELHSDKPIKKKKDE